LLERLNDAPAEATSDEAWADIEDWSEDQTDDKTTAIPDIEQSELNRLRQQRQQRILIGAVAFFVLSVLCAAGFVIYDDLVGRYTLLPPPDFVTREADSPQGGEASINFNGYPGLKARIEWTRDNDLETCSQPGMGLEVNFQTSPTFPISNQVCAGDSCAFEKELNGAAIGTTNITYICGKDAKITLFNTLE
jgi:hypothetical protein